MNTKAYMEGYIYKEADSLKAFSDMFATREGQPMFHNAESVRAQLANKGYQGAVTSDQLRRTADKWNQDFMGRFFASPRAKTLAGVGVGATLGGGVGAMLGGRGGAAFGAGLGALLSLFARYFFKGNWDQAFRHIEGALRGGQADRLAKELDFVKKKGGQVSIVADQVSKQLQDEAAKRRFSIGPPGLRKGEEAPKLTAPPADKPAPPNRMAFMPSIPAPQPPEADTEPVSLPVEGTPSFITPEFLSRYMPKNTIPRIKSDIQKASLK